MPDPGASSSSLRLREILWTVGLLLVAGGVFWGFFAAIQYHWEWVSFWKYRTLILKGWGWTVLIALGALLVAVPLAFGLMMGQRSPWVGLRLACRGYVELVRGTPLLTQLMIGYYLVANAMHINEPILVGMVLLASFEAAYLAEIFRGALESIGASQIEAAMAVGFDRAQMYRYVIIPQAMRRALPGAAGQLASLIKDSSLLSVLGIEELTQIVKIANSAGATAMEGYMPLAALYLALTLPLSWWARHLEGKFKYET